MKKSMIDLAFDILTKEKKAMKFLDLWTIVSKEMGFTPSQSDDNIAQFYSDLSIDGRFASLPGNTWDLRKRQSSAHTIVDTDSISVEDENDYVRDDGDESEEVPIEDDEEIEEEEDEE
ncbi:DNA-directed RNA polymerase subunit delta [Erysipelotrichaceae bacterium RD49]|nr:DNA-directed RNA polymerase subunit delta [Erysipelotrichaceae bacterium RD49]